MTNWKYTLNIKQDLIANKSPENVGKNIARRIKLSALRKFLNWEDIDNFDENLEEIIDALENISGFDEVSPVEELDEWLEALYDWADLNRIWLSE